jgi:hypothetical protein
MDDFGYYYQYVEINYDLMKKYYLMAVDRGHSNSMNNLGYYYQYIEINYDLMKKYYLMAIDKGNVKGMHKLGCYYQYTEKNYDLMKKYYLMAIDKGNVEAMRNLGYYYVCVKENYDLGLKYYTLAANKGSIEVLTDLGEYYKNIGNYKLMEKYYFLGINKGSYSALHRLDYYYYYMEYYYHYRNQIDNYDLRSFLFAIIKGNFKLTNVKIFNEKNISKAFKNKIIDLFCSVIKIINAETFIFCLPKIVDYVNHINLSNNKTENINYITKCVQKLFCFIGLKRNKKEYNLYNFKHFMKYMSQLFYCNYNKINKDDNKKINKEDNNKINKNERIKGKWIQTIFKDNVPQIFMEYLNFQYYKHIDKIYSPGGEGYIKTKKHFELIAKQ